MNQPIPTGPDRFGFAEDFALKAKYENGYDSDRHRYFWQAADFHATQAQISAIVMLTEVIATATGVDHNDLDAWREKIGVSWLKECKGREIRRPQCAERHTEDCSYADPVPEPKHELLPVGTRVLVSDPHDRNCVCSNAQPWVGKIAGYDMHRSKYQVGEEIYGRPGEYYSHVRWVFADNRVEVHPDGPESTPPEPVKQKPTGPRIYVQHRRGMQGHIVGTRTSEPEEMPLLVQWYKPGVQPMWVSMKSVKIIAESEVARCPNGQTGDECGSGENQCELCLQAEDAEADAIERGTGL